MKKLKLSKGARTDLLTYAGVILAFIVVSRKTAA